MGTTQTRLSHVLPAYRAMPHANHPELTKTVTVAKHRELEAAGDRAACVRFNARKLTLMVSTGHRVLP